MYHSPIHRFRTVYHNRALCKEFDYRNERTVEEGVYHDVFDGGHFQGLLSEHVRWGDSSYRHKYFDQPTDLALCLMTDGVPCFNRNGLDCWPLLLTVYSVRPELRQRKEWTISCGVIPGVFEIAFSSFPGLTSLLAKGTAVGM
jgi:hypothetical protein